MIPMNAKSIIKARMQGFKPAELILISLIGKISESNYTVLASPEQRYDWRWVRDLGVCVFITPECDWRGTVLEIRKAMPRHMWLWDAPNKRGATVYLKPTHPASEDKHVKDWDWVLDFRTWWGCENKGFVQCN
jgi:hypothetical protein